MKLKLAAWMTIPLVIFLFTANAQTIGTNRLPQKTTASKLKAGTNAPVNTTTNLLPNTLTNQAPDTVTNTAPEIPKDNYTNSIGMKLLKVPGDFWAGQYEVTQGEYQQIIGSNPSAFNGDLHPVDNVSWNDAMQFCLKLTAHEIKEKKLPEDFFYALPTEAQWETLVADTSLANAVTSQNRPRNGTATVGSLNANSLGLYDVRGNVMEFTLGDPSLPYRVLLGGSWQDRIEINLRTAFRFYASPTDSRNTFGFRCILMRKPSAK
ncbi:MAG: pkn1 3 [Pedosphaera sp.]|nr:pkn1 3 [Pedosphaera sp.]